MFYFDVIRKERRTKQFQPDALSGERGEIQ